MGISHWEASLDHFLSIFCFIALVDGVPLHLKKFFIPFVSDSEPDALVESDGDLVLGVRSVLHPDVLEAVAVHFVKACVFFGDTFLGLELVPHSDEASFEFFKRNFSIVVLIEVFHEHLDLFFDGWVAVRLVEQLLHLVGSDEARLVFVDSLEGFLKFLVGVNRDSESIDER